MQTGGGGIFDPSDLNSIDQRIPQIPAHLIDYRLNPKAFINAHNFANLDKLVEEVKRMDNDAKAYEAMRNEPLFLDNFDFKSFYEQKVLDFFEKIFAQGPKLAFRRGSGGLLQRWQDVIKNPPNTQNLSDKMILPKDYLTKDGLNIGRFVSKIQRKIKKFRFWKKKIM